MTATIKDNWYEDFFQGINCELCEKAYPAQWTNQELGFLTTELQLKPGQHLLDVPCGAGRHSIEFAKRGFAVTGIDIAATFITGLKEKIKSENLNLTAIHADVLALELTQKFAGAICMGNSFGYFNFDKMKLFVKKVAASLEPGARFIINSGMIAESILQNFSANESFTVDDFKMDITNSYHVEDSYMISELLYTRGNQTETHSFKHYIFTLAEVKRLLQLYGLKTIATYSSTDKAVYHMGDQQVYIVSEKE